MARKKKETEQRPADYWTNPYYREEEERKKKLDPNRSRFFLNLFIPLGLLGGVALGWFMDNLILGAPFGLVVGIMVGTQLDLKFPRTKKDDSQAESDDI